MTRSISLVRPMTGSSSPFLASSVRSRPKARRAGVFDLLAAGGTAPAADIGGFHVVVFGREIRVEFAEDFVAGALDVDVEVLQNSGGHAVAFAEEPEEDVLGADVGMSEGFGFLTGEGEDFLHARRVRNVADHLGLGTGADLFFDFHANGLEIEAHLGQDVDGHALAEFDQAEEEVLGAHVVVVEPIRLLAGKGENLLGAWREIVHLSFFLPLPFLVGVTLAISGSGIFFTFARTRSARKVSRSSGLSFSFFSASCR